MTEGARRKGRRALGQGLDALLPPAPQTAVQEVDLGRIIPNPDQPRQHIAPDALEALAASIQEHGIIQPLVVSRTGDDRYRLIVGERRWRAAHTAGLQRVPVVVKEATDQQTLELALVENLHREDLNPLEEAAAYRRLMEDFGLTQQEVAQRAGKSRTAVANTVRLLSLPETLKRAVLENRVTEGHARAILGLDDMHAQLSVLARVEREGLTVRQTEDLVRRLTQLEPAKPQRMADPDVAALEDELRRALGSKVMLRPRRKGGRIVIEYYSDEEFQGIYERLRG